jgi:DNA-binding transcriptional LysR family regulator
MDRLAAMETFVRVVESGSFSAAARALNVGQPAVSKTVAQIEDRLGLRLLLRSSRGLTTTEAGQIYYERARRLIEDADDAEIATRGTGAGLKGRLRICAGVTFARLHIVPRLGRFLDANPELSIDIVLDDRKVDLIEEGIDVALRMGTLGDSALTAKKIGASKRLVIGTPDYFARAGKPHVPKDLKDHQAIVYALGGGDVNWTFRRGGAEESVVVDGRMHVTAAEGIRAAVLAHLGVAIASEWMFAPEIRSRAVQPVLRDWTLPSVDLWAIYPSGRKVSAKARAFVAFVEQELHAASPKRRQR